MRIDNRMGVKLPVKGEIFMLAEKKEDYLLTIAEVAKRLRVDSTTVRRWISTGTLEAVMLPPLNKREKYRVKLSSPAAGVCERKISPQKRSLHSLMQENTLFCLFCFYATQT